MGPGASLAEKMGEILHLSNDSVYRRLRGETLLTIDELGELSRHFNFSLDGLLNRAGGSVSFRPDTSFNTKISLDQYFDGAIRQMKFFNGFEEKEIYYLCKDIPLFHFFQFRELALFKIHFWMKSIMNEGPACDKKFSVFTSSYNALLKKAEATLQEYNQLPATEVWSLESINSTIRQIEYYRETGEFASEQDARAVIQSLSGLLDHLQDQLNQGTRYFPGQTATAEKTPFSFYVNELIIGNNTIQARLNGRLHTFINHGVLHYLHTSDQPFGEYTLSSIQNLIQRSTLISITGEKERNKFFNTLRKTLER